MGRSGEKLVREREGEREGGGKEKGNRMSRLVCVKYLRLILAYFN